ncbi:ABC transporter substrate-binding protein [Jeotgalibacillus sp. S-D1]|uniref:ABC transporter substrate-binding protein n=1 Tax=Jeotgalibacillus sp. S-D1 TaxID=2552189 RepID=UPI00105A7006|nr:ABC transporter substrate-binding protein [Jeotgalibacillus sp. S-D1]TDL30797.1 ABC transporter substrate-binding protein [Jeotgalibacillus sp. S-D1]
MKWKSILNLIFVVGLIWVISGCSSSGTSPEGTGSSSSASDKNSLKVAYQAQPDTLDPTVTTAEATAFPARLMYESLVTLNENYEVTAQLAESYEISEDGKTISFKLREGIKFHNGKEMLADDVIASLTRWQENSSLTKSILAGSQWKKIDDYTIDLILSKPSSIVLHILADQTQLAAIMPKEIIEAADPTGATEYIGTGPFKFDEWKQDQYIHFVKNEEYQSDADPVSGLAGEKEALVEDIYWYVVPDVSTRSAGLMSGEYDVVIGLPYDSVDQIESTGNKTEPYTYGMEILVFNKKEGLFTDVKARQAVNYALDKEVVLQAAFTDEKYFELEAGLFTPERTDWYTDTGKELYNPKDLDKAKQLLKESGYNGEEIIILTSRDYIHHYNAAIATQQQLEGIGMKVKLEVYDWATLLEHRADSGSYDIFFTGWDTAVIPHQYGFLDSKSEWPGWTNNTKIDELLEQIGSTPSQEEAKALAAELQQEVWSDLPIINIGNYKNINGYSDKVTGFKHIIGPVLWNVSVSE